MDASMNYIKLFFIKILILFSLFTILIYTPHYNYGSYLTQKKSKFLLFKNELYYTKKNFKNSYQKNNISYCYGNNLLAQILNNKIDLYLHNKSNAVININTKIYYYNPYGKLEPNSNNFQFIHHFLYDGQRCDYHTNLIYLKARFYNSNLNRFITQDSYNFLNRFNYADSNPIMKHDPTGHFSLFNFFSGVAGIGLILALGFSALGEPVSAALPLICKAEVTPIMLNIIQIFCGIFDNSLVRKIAWINTSFAMPAFSISIVGAGVIKSIANFGLKLALKTTPTIMSFTSIGLNSSVIYLSETVWKFFNWQIPDSNPDDSFRTAMGPELLNLLGNILAVGSFLLVPGKKIINKASSNNSSTLT